MKVNKLSILSFYALLFTLVLLSCESDEQRLERIKLEIEIKKSQAKLIAETKALNLRQKEQAERNEQERRLKRERQIVEENNRKEAIKRQQKKKQDDLLKWRNNSLRTGAMPWVDCFGSSNSCSSGCSQISVKTPYKSDVLVTLKQYGQVVRHAYINQNSTYTFEIPNGTYQPFFYYGTGWNPNKTKESKSCGTLNGAFLENEHISKDEPQSLSNNILSYELILQENGNLQTKPSNENEAF